MFSIAALWIVLPVYTNAQLSASGTASLPSSSFQPTTVSESPTGTTQVVAPTFPPIGSIKPDFSPSGLEQLWNLVGPITSPPFTTTRIPSPTPIVLPQSPPPLYPSWFAPSPQDIFPKLKLPAGFKFGVATAAYQVEGAAKNEGKGPNSWDWASRQPGGIVDNSTADIVDLHYYLYKEDVKRVAALGVNAHSFSISWARVFPFGTADSPVNQAALDHYSDVIDSHWSQGVEPVVTLFHWDTPLALLAYYGGFTSSKIVDDFVHYAKTVFKAYNGRVKTWYTFNEPRVYCGQTTSYPFNVTIAPGLNSSTAFFICNYNIIKAHALAVKAFREMKIEGEIAFKNDDFVGIPWRTNSTEDMEAVERHAAFQIGVYSDPIYLTGDWPEVMKETLSPEILPRFTEQEKKDNLGSADFFAIDPYRNQWVAAPPNGIAACVANSSDPLWPACNTVVLFDSNSGWATGPSPDPHADSWLQATPQFFRRGLLDLQQRWPTKKMYISEFGFVEPFENLRTELFRIKEDVTRTNYFSTYLGEALLSMHEDKVPIAGAFAWAMMDNMEWNSGLSTRFGIQFVNYTTLEREYKRSAMMLSQFFKGRIEGNATASL